ncbi:MAG: TIGR04255 family protein [bacterium]|nr:TIGR04255 family protein [bacterium]
MEHTREVFANAPLAFVVCEIRFPQAPRLTSEESFVSLTDAFAGTLDIPEEERTGDGAERRFRFLSTDRVLSAVVARNALTVETTDYTEWPDFKAVVVSAVDIVAAAASVVGVERVGLRFVNEIRVPEPVNDVTQWARWINEPAFGSVPEVAGYVPAIHQVATRLTRETTHLHVQYAALVGPGVVSDGPLRRRADSGKGPFFVIDTDSYSDSPGQDMLPFNSGALEPALDDLHRPLESLFHRAIRDELRDVFRGTR